jgi:hypothetical protein
MTSYRAAEGTDVTLGSLTVLSPQPDEGHGGGIQYEDVTRAADGTLIKQGPFFPFRWEQLSAAQYVTITTAFGLNDSDFTNVTIYVRDVDLATWVRMNGVAQRPFPGDTVTWDVRPQDVTIMVTNLTAAS